MTHLTQFNKKFSEQQLETLFDAADTDKDGAIQYEELCSWLCDTPCFSRYFQELDKIEKEYHRRLASYESHVDDRNEEAFKETFDAMATESGDRARRKSDPQIQLLVAQGD
ncbi:unnamed protein product [Durusdinium trenchii]|uniref:EF-hand domain-containing protein n=1 Tax=Durusdinium trenchii TaxID=1381693 RepID=A0ABP0KYD7_9DINO